MSRTGDATRARAVAVGAALAVAVGASEAAQAATVTCGQVITASTAVGNDLTGCPGDGLRIGADDIVLDLNGHVISGRGPEGDGAGIAFDGHRGVTVQNGVVRDFPIGVAIDGDSNVVRRVTVRGADTGMYIPGGDGNRISGSAVIDNDLGINEDRGNDNTIAGVTARGNHFAGIVLQGDGTGSTGGNTVTGSRIIDNGPNGGLGVFYERRATITDNTLSGHATTGFFGQSLDSTSVIAANVSRGAFRAFWVRGSGGLFGSDGGPLLLNNRALSSTIGFHIDGSPPAPAQGDQLVGNRAQLNREAGFLIDGGVGTLLRDNIAGSESGQSGRAGGNGVGIDLRGDSAGVRLWGNRAHSNRGDGILVREFNQSDIDLRGNQANFNGDDGIDERSGDATLTANRAFHNADVGIFAQPTDVDGGGNEAANNGAAQCIDVEC